MLDRLHLSAFLLVFIAACGGTEGNSGGAINRVGIQLDGAPTNFQAVAISPTEVRLTWEDPFWSEESFVIERKTTGSFGEIGMTAANATTYTDGGLEPEQTYTYRVRGRNAVGDSAASRDAIITTLAVPIPLLPPTTLVSLPISYTLVQLTWDDNTDQETEYVIERYDGNFTEYYTANGVAPPYQEINRVSAGMTFYIDGGRSAQTWYSYRVRAVISDGGSDKESSDYSNEDKALTFCDESVCPRPYAPTNFAASPVSPGILNLTWQANSSLSGAYYNVERREAGGIWETIGVRLPIDTQQLLDDGLPFHTGLTSGTTYEYRIQALMDVGTPYDWVSIFAVAP